MLGKAVGNTACLLGASTAFSWIGLLYVGIPLAVLVLTAMILSTATCRPLPLLVSGGLGAIATIVVFVLAVSEVQLDRDALMLNLAACCGAVVGAASFRALHRLFGTPHPGALRDE